MVVGYMRVSMDCDRQVLDLQGVGSGYVLMPIEPRHNP
jgi:hypothetical protein